MGRTEAAYDTSNFPVGSTNWEGASPSLDVIVGGTGRLMVTIGCQMDYNTPSTTSGGWGGRMGVTLSGANSIGADPGRALVFRRSHTQVAAFTASSIDRASYTHFYTGLTPGLTTITCQYSRTDGASPLSVADRTLVVMPY